MPSTFDRASAVIRLSCAQIPRSGCSTISHVNPQATLLRCSDPQGEDWLFSVECSDSINPVNLVRLTDTPSTSTLPSRSARRWARGLEYCFVSADGSVELLAIDDWRGCLELKARLDRLHVVFLRSPFRPIARRLLKRVPAFARSSNDQNGWRPKAPHPVASEHALDNRLEKVDCRVGCRPART